jgi:hypothetical protein
MSRIQLTVNNSLGKKATDYRQNPIAEPIQTATVSNREDAIAALVLAFSADPVARWMYPEPQQYLTYFPNFVRAFGGKAFESGTAYYVEGYFGTALWFPPGVERSPIGTCQYWAWSLLNRVRAVVRR